MASPEEYPGASSALLAHINEVEQAMAQRSDARTITGKNVSQISPYVLLYDADNGTGGFRTGDYLIEHPREKDVNDRKNYSAYFNYVQPILNARVSPVFDRPAMRTTEGNTIVWDEFFKNCDGRGTTLNDFIRDSARKSVRDAVNFIIMDAQEEQPATLGEAIALRTYPYLSTRSAGECVYYETDNFGNLTAIAFAECYKTAAGKDAIGYKFWNSIGWELYKEYKSGKFTGLISYGFGPGFLPVIPFYSVGREPKEILPFPPMYSVARCNLQIFNITSEIRELQRSQGFSLLVYPMKRIANAIVVGLKNVLNFDPESRFIPQYISPDAEIQKNFESERNTYVVEIYRMADLLGVMGRMKDDKSTGTGSAQSGVSKEWEFKSTSSVLGDMAARAEAAERAVAQMFADFTQIEFSYEVRYSREFGIMDAADEITRATDSLALGIGGEFDLETVRRLAKNLFPEKDEAAIDAIVEEFMAKRANDLEDQSRTLNEDKNRKPAPGA